MKNWKKILIVALCLSLVQIPAFPEAGSIVAEAAGETGLQKEGGKIYYYSNGKKVTDTWMTVKETFDGQVIEYSYYFKSDGSAYTGKVSSGIMVPAVKKIGGKYYGFDQLGHMLKGVYVKKGKFYAFDASTGERDAAATQKLRAAAKAGTKYSTLTKLLKSLGVKRVKKQTGLASSRGNGTEIVYSYPGFDVRMFKNSQTKATTIVSVTATATQVSAVTGTEKEEGSTDDVESKVTQTASGLRKVNDKYYYYKKSGEILKSKWKTVGGYKYYFTADGSAQTGSAKIGGKLYLFDMKGRLAKGTGNRFKTVGQNRYYVNENGQPYTGYMVINKALYYANSKGVLKRNTTTSRGYVFDGNGKAKSNAASNLKITTMQIVASITNSTMTKEQKLKACWDYVVAGKRFTYSDSVKRYSSLNLATSGWQKQEALDMLNTRAGNCYGFACAFAALADEVGYTPYVIAGLVATRDKTGDSMAPHCWVQIDGKYYDPEAQFRGWWPGVYGLSSYDGVNHKVQYTVKFSKG